jgi:hypothetical protein
VSDRLQATVNALTDAEVVAWLEMFQVVPTISEACARRHARGDVVSVLSDTEVTAWLEAFADRPEVANERD